MTYFRIFFCDSQGLCKYKKNPVTPKIRCGWVGEGPTWIIKKWEKYILGNFLPVEVLQLLAFYWQCVHSASIFSCFCLGVWMGGVNPINKKLLEFFIFTKPLRGMLWLFQSEEEKQFQRLKRREEKKISKKGEKGGPEQEYIQSLNFDPKLLRAQR